jgi:hypothetical protein
MTMPLVLHQWAATDRSFQRRERSSATTPDTVNLVVIEYEAAEMRRRHVLTPDMVAKQIAEGKTADRSRFRSWADVRDALLRKNS